MDWLLEFSAIFTWSYQFDKEMFEDITSSIYNTPKNQTFLKTFTHGTDTITMWQIQTANIHIEGLQPIDIKSLRTIFKNEGCIDSENLFTDKEKAIALDDVQTRLSKQNHTDKKASADILICVEKNKYLLTDAKFRVKNINNISPSELREKLNGSKNIVQGDKI